MKLGGGQPSADGRNALLQSIQKGAKLKKTVTVDKSGPLIQGKVSGGGGGTIGNSNSSNRGPASAASGISDSNGGQKLGGIFEGLASMPKLKPVGSRGATTTAQSATISNKSPSPENTVKSNNRIGGGGGGGGGGGVDFADELAAKLTLKKQKNSSNSSTNNNNAIVNNNNNNSINQVPVTESNLRTNRGPPPQPPVQLSKVCCEMGLCLV